MKASRSIVWVVLSLCAFPAASLVAQDKSSGFTFHGYPDCIELKNDTTRVVVCGEGGGRVLEFAWKGENALYLEEAVTGKPHVAGKPAAVTAGRFDIGPEKTIPPHPKLWSGKWTTESLGPRAARLTSPKDDATGTQLVREFRLAERGSRLACTQTIHNVSSKTTEWCHWSRTFALGNGICFVPLTTPSRFPNGYVMYEDGDRINFRPTDPHIRTRDGFLEIFDVPKQPKLGMDSQAGWFAYLMKNNLLFVKRFPVDRDRVYNEVAGLTVSIWYPEDRRVELEPIGPRERLQPGQSASFTEEWFLVPFPFPKEGTPVDLTQLRDAVTLLDNPPGAEKKPEIVSVAKIWDKGKHNAFTDLIRWRGKWYCTFRESDAHVGGDGQIRVLESADGTAWESVALLSEQGIDLRDPKFSITPDDRLMIVAGGSVYGGTTVLKGRQPRVAFSKDARTWTPTQRVLTEGDWLWRVTWHDGKAYGVTYNPQARQTKEAQDAAKKTEPVSTDAADWKLRLVVSTDGVNYDLITHLGVPGNPNETTLRFLPTGEMLALVRREAGSTFGWIGSSKPPYRDWTWHETKHRFGGPNFIQLPDGKLWSVGRSYPGGAKTVLARMDRELYEPVLTFPSGGDTSYAGLVWHEGLLWVSYYSSHEGKTSIYLAKVRLP